MDEIFWHPFESFWESQVCEMFKKNPSRRPLESLETTKQLYCLKRKYLQLEEWDNLADVLETIIPDADGSKHKIHLFHELADIYEGTLDKPDLCFEILCAAFHEDQGNLSTLNRLESIAQNEDKWLEMLDLYEFGIGESRDIGIKTDLRARMVRICVEELRNPEKAFKPRGSELSLDIPKWQTKAEKVLKMARCLDSFDELVESKDP